MKPVCPLAPHEGAELRTFAENQQDDYIPLTASVDRAGVVMSEWEPTENERQLIAAGARIRIWMDTCRPFPLPPLPMPVRLEVTEPTERTIVTGKCGNCDGIQFTLLEVCDECGTSEVVEKLTGSK